MTKRKTCKTCGETKEISYFFTTAPTDAYRKQCKDCRNEDLNRKNWLRKGFQSLKPTHCECCGVRSDKLQVDHDHHSGHFRGFVCGSCNQRLQFAGDTYEGVKEKYDGVDQNYVEYMIQAGWRSGSTVLKQWSGKRKKA